ncbi:MAG: hypothetical protein KJ709_01215 [Nanoarchaeota archaeon]|nr:hypothetical protein [Nanoarchaeota archaeon]
MGAKTAIYGTLLLATAAGAFVAGRYSGQDSEYSIQRANGSAFLGSETAGKSYALVLHDNDVIMGDVDHHLKALRALASTEGIEDIMPALDMAEELRNREKAEDLKGKVDEAIDEIEKSVGNIKHQVEKHF